MSRRTPIVAPILILLLAGYLSAAPADGGERGTDAVTRALAALDAAEQRSAQLELEPAASTDAATLGRLSSAAALWNGGETVAALALLRGLEESGQRFAAGLSWRRPQGIEMDSHRIGTHTLVASADLDSHTPSGAIFAVMGDNDGGTSNWRVYRSDDGGASWGETYAWFTGNTVRDTDGAVVADYLYVAYCETTDPAQAKTRRFMVADGSSDTAYGYHIVHDAASATIEEVELQSNRDAGDDRLYLMALRSDGALRLFVSDEDGGVGSIPWTARTTGVNDASERLNLRHNAHGTSGVVVLASYVATDDSVKILRSDSAGSTAVLDLATWPGSDVTSSAFRDVAAVVALQPIGVNLGVAIWISHDGGATWVQRVVDDGVAAMLGSPVVTLLGASGIVVAYQRDVAGSPEVVMRHSAYDASLWSAAERAADGPVIGGSHAALEHLPGGGFGIVSLRPPTGEAWFDRLPLVFASGFEFGDTTQWTTVVP